MLADYDAIIQEQVKQGVVEKAPNEAVGKSFTFHTVPWYDASACERDNAPSLNDCLLTGPPLQKQLWSVLVRNRFHPVALAGDLQKAFLQV